MSVRKFAIYNLGGSLIPLALSIITVPIYLELIGTERYGVLALVWLLLGYFGLFDLGLGRATAQRIASICNVDPQKTADTFWTAIIINTGIGCIGGALIYLVAILLFGTWLEISPELLPELEVALYWLILSVPIATLSGVLIGALQGSSRFWELNVISVLGATMVQVFPLIAAYSISPSLEVLLPTAVSARLVVLVILFLTCRTHVFRSYRPRFSKPLATGLLSFGGWITVTSIVGPLMTMLDRFVIGTMLGAKGVTYYTIPYQLAERTVILSTSLAQALFPRFAVATIGEDRVLLRKGIHALAAFTTLPFVIGFFCIEPFLIWWIGPEFGERAGLVGQITLFGFWANGFARIIGAGIQARGRPELVAINHLCQLPAYLAALFAGLAMFGLPGAAVATSLRMLVDGLVLAWLSKSLLEVARTLAVPFILLSCAFAASVAFDSRAILWQSFILIAILAAIWSVKHSPFSLPRISLRNRTRPESSCSVPLMHQDKSEIGDHQKESSWPEEELERVLHCPICGSDRFQPMHEGLMDKVFFVAAGAWQLQRCENCRCAFLDPRPTRETIHRAYVTYYTHQSARSGPADTTTLSVFRRLRRVISNGYINNRFGANRPDAFRWGHIAAIMFPRQRALLNGEFRHLPKRPSGEGRLLDIGCGNGDFLVAAQSLGWSAFGIDLDSEAVREAKSQGCNAETGSVDALEFDDASFEVITISHVIEHVHDPIALLRRAFDLLKPGGTIYIETPNIDSEGSIYWGRNWRGLEPPRHLVLFNHQAFSRVLKDVGFDDVEFFHRGNVTAGIWRQSMNIAHGRDSLDKSGTLPNIALRKAQIAAVMDTRRSEFVTLVARKRHD